MEVPRMSAEELKRRLDSGERVVVLDVRKTADYEIQHIAGARSFSLKETPQGFQELPVDQTQTIVCY